MDDAQLVLAARAGDRAAFAALYDRYADRLHDLCHSILRDRDEAADAMHDTFLIAFEHLDRLREPAKARAWLYAIARHEALRRARRPDRAVPADDAGLTARDRALLDLHLRHGLEGQELADAAGVSASQVHVVLTRLRDHVERGPGSPLALLAAAPIVPAPPHLRVQVLTKLDRGSFDGPVPRLDRDGFPPSMGRRGRRRPALLGAIAAMLVVVLGLVLVLRPDQSPSASADGAPTAVGPTTVEPTAPPITTTTAAATTTSAPAVVPGLPGRLVVATAALDFGATGVLRQLRLRNPGEQAVLWSAAAAVAWVSVAPGSGGIAGGEETLVAVSLDRSRAPEGPFTATISVTGPEGAVAVALTGAVDRPPRVGGEATDVAELYTGSGACEPVLATVTATVTDGLGVTSVVLAWRAPDDVQGTAVMTAGSTGVWQGRLGPFTAAGEIEWWVVATDTGGNVARSDSHLLPVVDCVP